MNSPFPSAPSAPSTLPQATTVVDLLSVMLHRAPCSTALRWREAGYWRRMSTELLVQDIRRFALGLIRLGVKPGDSVGIYAPSSPFWLIADFAILSIGAISVPMFPNLSTEHLHFESDNVEMRTIVVIGEEQWKNIQPDALRWQNVIVKGVVTLPQNVNPWGRILDYGDELSDQDPGLFARRRGHLTSDSIATIIHTSGSTGNPKGVVLTHRNIMSQIKGARECFPLDPNKDTALSCLPLAHVFERIVVYSYLAQGIPIAFADDVKNIGALMKDIRPTIMSMVPRLIEKLYARIVKRLEDSLPPKRQLGRWALEHALHDDPTKRKPWTMEVADTLIFQRLRDSMGGRLQALIVGGAALAPDLGRFLTNVGLPVYCGYGLTEASPVLALNHPGDNKLGTVGRPFPGVEVRLTASGEIIARGPNIMRGYHKDPAATAAVIDSEGWLHTGDLGRFDESGYVVITGRVKELLKTSNGKYVSPLPIEHALCGCPYVDQAMIIAEGRPFAAALLFIEPDALKRAKDHAKMAQLSDKEFLSSTYIRNEMRDLLTEVNSHLDRWEQIHAYRFILKNLTVGEELTPTMKIKRHVVATMYHDVIDAMYQEATANVTS
jgi:long-chain acyl-CoA synthetase